MEGTSINCKSNLMNFMWSSFYNEKTKLLTIVTVSKDSVETYGKFQAIKFDVTGKWKFVFMFCISPFLNFTKLTSTTFVASMKLLVLCHADPLSLPNYFLSKQASHSILCPIHQRTVFCLFCEFFFRGQWKSKYCRKLHQ